MWPLKAKDIIGFLEKSDHHPTIIGEIPKNATLQRITTDSRDTDATTLFIPIKGERFDGHDFIMTQIVVRGCPLTLCNRQWYEQQGDAQKKVLSRICLIIIDNVLATFRLLAGWFRHRMKEAGLPVVAIGGSNGKTTTKELLRFLLGGEEHGIESTEKSENGYLGIAKTLTKATLSCSPNADEITPKLLITEIGIDTVGAMAEHQSLVQPDIALLSSLAEEHLEGLINFETVVKEEVKLMQPSAVRIWQWNDDAIRTAAIDKMTSNDWVTAVLPAAAHDQILMVIEDFLKQYPSLSSPHAPNLLILILLGTDTNPKLQAWSRERGSTSDSMIECFQAELNFTLPGEHNLHNLSTAMGAALATTALSNTPISRDTVSKQCQQLPGFKNADFRSALKALDSGNTLFVDCYNANPASVHASLKILNQAPFIHYIKFIFLGDMLDLGPTSKQQHEALLSALAPIENSYLFLYGTRMADLAKKALDPASTWPKLVVHSEHNYDTLAHACAETLKNAIGNQRPIIALLKASRGMKMEALIEPLSRIL